MEMDTVQIKGVDSTERITKADLSDNATLVIKEKIRIWIFYKSKFLFIISL